MLLRVAAIVACLVAVDAVPSGGVDAVADLMTELAKRDANALPTPVNHIDDSMIADDTFVSASFVGKLIKKAKKKYEANRIRRCNDACQRGHRQGYSDTWYLQCLDRCKAKYG